MFKNMKISVDNNLNEIVAELERLGFNRDDDCHAPNELYGIMVFILGRSFNTCDQRSFNWQIFSDHELTTLAELKEM